MYLFMTDGYQFGDASKFAFQMLFGLAFIICLFYALRSWLTAEVMLGLYYPIPCKGHWSQFTSTKCTLFTII